jgi:hypothetical protein
LSGHRAIGAGTIFDDHRLLERGTERIGDDAANRVAGAAGAEHRYEGDGTRRIIVGAKRGAEKGGAGRKNESELFHDSSPNVANFASGRVGLAALHASCGDRW